MKQLILAVSALIFASCNPYGKPFDASMEGVCVPCEVTSGALYGEPAIAATDSGGNGTAIGTTTKKDFKPLYASSGTGRTFPLSLGFGLAGNDPMLSVMQAGDPVLISDPKKKDFALQDSGGGSTATGSTLDRKKRDRHDAKLLATSGGSIITGSERKKERLSSPMAAYSYHPQNFGHHG